MVHIQANLLIAQIFHERKTLELRRTIAMTKFVNQYKTRYS